MMNEEGDEDQGCPNEKTKSAYEQATIRTAMLHIVGEPTTSERSHQATPHQDRTSDDTSLTDSQTEGVDQVRGEPEGSATNGEKAKNQTANHRQIRGYLKNFFR